MKKEEEREIEVLDTGCDIEKKWPRSVCCWGSYSPLIW